VVTCTGQPADQEFGIVSRGPDGVADTHDDIVSWMLPDVRDVLHGSRWRTTVAAPPTPRSSTPVSSSPASTPKRPTPKDTHGNGIPDCRTC
jgi:hypothetical protein